MYLAERNHLELIFHGGLTGLLLGMVRLRSWLLRSTDKIILSNLAAFSAGLRYGRIEASGKFVFAKFTFLSMPETILRAFIFSTAIRSWESTLLWLAFVF